MIEVSIAVADDTGRQNALDHWLCAQPAGPRAVLSDSWQPLSAPSDVRISQISGGCVCCTGQVPLKLTLAKLLREHRPRSILLLIADAAHLQRVRALLADGTLGLPLKVN